MQTRTHPRSLFALLALASLASAAFSVWVVAQVIDDRLAAMRPEIYGALLQFLARGLIA